MGLTHNPTDENEDRDDNGDEVPFDESSMRESIFFAVYAAFRNNPYLGLTLDDLEDMTNHRPHSISGIRTALEKDGSIRKTNATRKGRAGRNQAVYRMVV